MTAPVRPVSVPSSLGEAFDRIRILEAVVTADCCPDWQDIELTNEPYVMCPPYKQCLQYANNCCALEFQGMLMDGNDQTAADEQVGFLPAAFWPPVDFYTVIPFEMFNGDLVTAVLYVSAVDGEVRVQWWGP